jgi:hypothetical protein
MQEDLQTVLEVQQVVMLELRAKAARFQDLMEMLPAAINGLIEEKRESMVAAGQTVSAEGSGNTEKKGEALCSGTL